MSTSSSSVPLSVALHEHTRDAHSRTEESGFVTSLMHGEACHGAYSAMVSQHLAIYRALESTLWQHYRDDPMVAPFLDPRLNRVAALEHDLVTLLGQEALDNFGTGFTTLTPATEAYVDALSNGHTPERMLANHYVRYLGDLSGGQIVATLVRRHYDIDDEAVTFYQFDDIGKLKPYKDEYRAKLDQLSVTDEQRELLFAEAEASFSFNRAVFVDLAAARETHHDIAGVSGASD